MVKGCWKNSEKGWKKRIGREVEKRRMGSGGKSEYKDIEGRG